VPVLLSEDGVPGHKSKTQLERPVALSMKFQKCSLSQMGLNACYRPVDVRLC